MKTLRCSNLKYTTKAPLILLTVNQIEREISIFFFPFFLPFPSCITKKLCGISKRSAHQTNALLLENLLFLVGAACELRLASYGSKHVLQSLSHMPFCVYLQAHSKTKGFIKTFYLSNNCSTIGDIYSLG